MILYWRIYRQGWKAIVSDRQFQAFIAAGMATSLLMTFFLWYQDGFRWPTALFHGALNGLSAQSTAGFASLDTSTVGSGSKLTLLFAMAVGGSIGSTAGGVKILRLLIVFQLLYLMLRRAGAPPNAVLETRFKGRRIESEEIQSVIGILTAFFTIVALSWLPFIALGHAPFNALFEVISALGTAGLSTGITAAGLHPLLKLILCVDMLLGRLEIIAWLVFFYPHTWMGLRRE